MYVQASSFLVSSVISFQPHVITLILLESTLVCVNWFLTVQRVSKRSLDLKMSFVLVLNTFYHNKGLPLRPSAYNFIVYNISYIMIRKQLTNIVNVNFFTFPFDFLVRCKCLVCLWVCLFFSFVVRHFEMLLM